MATPATTTKPKKEIIFDAAGNEVDETTEGAEETEETEATEEETEEVDETEATDADDDAEAQAAAAAAATNKDKPKGKYRIGDQYFNTIAEAQAFATQGESVPNSELNAYRQGILDASKNAPGAQNVTPAPVAGEIDEEYYSNPAEFLRKRDERLKNETVQTVQQTLKAQQYGDQVWNEFSSRHSDLADFREEVDAWAAKNQDQLRAVVEAKGRNAGLDYVALNIKAQFQRIADATKKKRALPNAGAGASPGGARTNVTLKKDAKKILSFAEQVKSIKRVQR